MKRVLAVLASASFVLAIGCSDYDIRLEKTLEEMKIRETSQHQPRGGSDQGQAPGG